MRKSLSRTVGSKAQEMLGLGPNSKSRVLEVQRQGYLYKKPFSSNGRGQWQKRFFVLKDSFLLWYTSKPSAAFDMYPAGCIPLGGCTVFPCGKENDAYVFEISHPDFDGNTLLLKSKDNLEVEDWINVLQESSKATWQNAMLGDALIQKLKHAGTAAEKEREEALQEARRAAELMAEAREEKLQLMEAQLERQRRFEEELLQERERAAALQDEVEQHEAQLLREQKEQEREEQHARELQQKLDDALVAIGKLEAAVERRQRTDLPGMAPNPELQDHIRTIKAFMSQRFGGPALDGDSVEQLDDEGEDYREQDEEDYEDDEDGDDYGRR